MALLVFQIEVVLGCKLTQDFVFSGMKNVAKSAW
jgi:hypothetical protein